MDTRMMRDPQHRREALLQFPRKSKGKFERTAARAPDRNKYRKDFKRISKKK